MRQRAATLSKTSCSWAARRFQTTERYLGRSQKAHTRVFVSSDFEKAGAGIDKNGHSEEDTRLSKDRLRRFEVYHSGTMLLSTLVKGSP
jgi:hypothetical protein